jgi:hypothetical protein
MQHRGDEAQGRGGDGSPRSSRLRHRGEPTNSAWPARWMVGGGQGKGGQWPSQEQVAL